MRCKRAPEIHQCIKERVGFPAVPELYSSRNLRPLGVHRRIFPLPCKCRACILPVLLQPPRKRVVLHPSAAGAVPAHRGALFAEIPQDKVPETSPGLGIPLHIPEPPEFHVLDLYALGFRDVCTALTVLQQIFSQTDVPLLEEKDTFGFQSVSPGASGFLIVAFHGQGQIVMNHIAHIAFVNAHAERIGCDHDLRLVKLKQILILPAFFVRKPRMIARRFEAFLAEQITDGLHVFPAHAVDNARLGLHFPAQGNQLTVAIFGVTHFKEEIGPVKPGHRDIRTLQFQKTDDVCPDFFCGRRCKSTVARARLQGLDETGDLLIFRPEFMSPVGDTVGFVHGDERNLQTAGQVLKAGSPQALGCNIDDLVGPVRSPFHGQMHLLFGQ